ncbi:MAG: LptF/LptG family permease [Sulfurimonas sp.]|jgi:lipopolysaccharide export system permease protein|nr:LptF/LptG family permease [Sulfurimonadaceae bacterium]
MVFRYVATHFIRYFFIILSALVLFMVGFDYIANPDMMGTPANILLLYIMYKMFYAIDMLLPLSLVFAMVATKISFIRSNALVSFYSLGYTKKDILKPFILVSSAVILIFIALHFLPPFTKANDFAKNIKQNSTHLAMQNLTIDPYTSDLFFTYKNNFVYFSRLIPLQEKALGIRVFSIKDDALEQILLAKEASFKDGSWHIKSADIIKKPDDLSFKSLGIEVSKESGLDILKGFRPKVLDQIYEGKSNFTIDDAFEAYLLLKDENINTNLIRSVIYKMLFFPLFAPLLIVILFFFVPISSRFLNISIFTLLSIAATIGVWAVLFMLSELSNNKVIVSEISILLPIFLLFTLSIWQYKKSLSYK